MQSGCRVVSGGPRKDDSVCGTHRSLSFGGRQKQRRVGVGPNRNGLFSHFFFLSTNSPNLPPFTMANREPRPRYAGSHSTLVISFDIGTTFSGASYVFLIPGEVPQIKSVTGCVPATSLTPSSLLTGALSSYVGQEDQSGSNKVPSVLVYTTKGQLVACGAEATSERYDDNPDYIRVEW